MSFDMEWPEDYWPIGLPSTDPRKSTIMALLLPKRVADPGQFDIGAQRR